MLYCFLKMPIRPLILIVLDLLRNTNSISGVLPPVNSATIYCGGSLTEKIITREYFVMKSAVFCHFGFRHVCHTF